MINRVSSTLSRWFRWAVHFVQECLDVIFNPDRESTMHWLSWLFLSGVFLFGVYFWGKFFYWGNYQLDYHDWGWIYVPRIMAVQEALRTGVLPLHMTSTIPLDGLTDRFFAVADVITTPEMLLLFLVSVDRYILIQTLILLSFSTLGLLWLKHHFHLSLFTYGVMFILFNFSGYIQAHLGAGHATWWCYFLLPWLMVLVVQFIENRLGWRWVAALSFFCLYLVLLGGYHFYVWALIFLTILGLVCYDRFKWMLLGLVGSALLCMVRLLPPALVFTTFTSIHTFLGGYPSLYHLWLAMVSIQPAGTSWDFPNVQPPWEYDLFVGILGTLIILYFGILQWVKNRDKFPELNKLALPALALLLLSMGNIYLYLEKIPIPLLAGEKMTSRLIVLPFLVVITTTAIFLNQWLSDHPGSLFRIGFLGISLLLLNDLFAHAELWNVKSVAIALGGHAPIAANVLANRPDILYTRLLLAGFIITILTAAFLLLMVWREHAAQKLEKRLPGNAPGPRIGRA
jgi:hypothetical protein